MDGVIGFAANNLATNLAPKIYKPAATLAEPPIISPQTVNTAPFETQVVHHGATIKTINPKVVHHGAAIKTQVQWRQLHYAKVRNAYPNFSKKIK